MTKPEKKDRHYFLSTITHGDKELAETQAISMEIGYSIAIDDCEKWLPGRDDIVDIIDKYLNNMPNEEPYMFRSTTRVLIAKAISNRIRGEV
jgi:hypothetical protein